MEYRLNQDLKEAILKQDTAKMRTIRSIKTAMRNLQVTNKTQEALSNEEIIKLIQKQAKQRVESIEMYVGREDLIAIEQEELVILNEYLPREIPQDKLEEIVNKNLDLKMMKLIINAVKDEVASQGYIVDGRKLSESIKSKL